MLALLPTVALLLAGCQTAYVAHPLTADHGSNDVGDQLAFWHGLAARPVTSNDEAFHGLLVFLDGEDPASDYAGRVATLRSRGMLPGGFKQPAHQAVERGTLAVAIVKALKIKGGLFLHIFAGNPRYAVRELQFMELYPPSSPRQTFSGTEFLGIIGKLEDYQRKQQGGAMPAEAGIPEPERRGPEVPPEPRPGELPQPDPPGQVDAGAGLRGMPGSGRPL
jgi:hypothetical protein